MRPRGRRPAGADTRGQIVDAARAEFGERGYEAASLRAVARRAGVDSALVHHYFEGKAQLFAEVMTVPADPRALIDRVIAGPRDQVGAALVGTFFAIWDTPEGSIRFNGLIRSVLTHEEAARMVREFLLAEVFARVARAFAAPGEEPEAVQRRAALAAAQLVGMAMLRYAVRQPALAEADPAQLAELLAPVLQGYLVPALDPAAE